MFPISLTDKVDTGIVDFDEGIIRSSSRLRDISNVEDGGVSSLIVDDSTHGEDG